MWFWFSHNFKKHSGKEGKLWFFKEARVSARATYGPGPLHQLWGQTHVQLPEAKCPNMIGFSFTSKTSCFDGQEMRCLTSEFDLEGDHLCKHLAALYQPDSHWSSFLQPTFWSDHQLARLPWDAKILFPPQSARNNFWGLPGWACTRMNSM